MDDPLTFGKSTAQDVVAAANAASVHIVLVASARTSDWQTRDEREFVGRLTVMSTVEVSDRLSAKELSELPDYLVKLGVASDRASAISMVGSSTASSSSDVLSTL